MSYALDFSHFKLERFFFDLLNCFLILGVPRELILSFLIKGILVIGFMKMSECCELSCTTACVASLYR